MEDAQILDAFWNRDEVAISAAEETYGRYCASIAGNILDCAEDVEEILSDTWLRAWNSIPPQRPDNLKLYLARITRNLSYDRFRTQTREKRGGGEIAVALHELSDCIPSSGQPGDRLDAEELREAINCFLATLPHRDRSVFLLRYFYAEPIEAIASRYGIRVGLVRTILSRTRKKLKNYLIKEDFWL